MPQCSCWSSRSSRPSQCRSRFHANRRLVDSLLNYEAVKFYANEAFEAQRFRSIHDRLDRGRRQQSKGADVAAHRSKRNHRDEDGHTLLRRVRTFEAERHIPLAERMPAIALTGYAQAEDRMHALARRAATSDELTFLEQRFSKKL